MKTNYIRDLLLGRIAFKPEDGTGGGEAAPETTTTTPEDTSGETAAPADDGGQQPVLGGGGPGEKPDETGDEGGNATGGETEEEDASLNEVPEDGKYEVFEDLPEDLQISEEDRGFWNQTFAEMGLTKAQAQKVRDIALVDRQRQIENAQREIEEQQNTHLEQAMADREIGGDNWETSVALANKALEVLRGGPRQEVDKDGNPVKGADGKPKGRQPSAIETMILATGNGNNPEMIRELRRLGELFKDDNFNAGKPVGAPVPTEDRWYGETTPSSKRG